MKKIIVFIFTSLAVISINAQSVEEGNRFLYQERYIAASQNFKAVVQQQPHNADAWYGLTRAMIHQDKAGNLQELLHNAPVQVKSEPMFKAAYGYSLLALGKTDSAAFYFKNALEDSKEKDVAVLLAIAQASVENKSGNAVFAQELIQKALKKDKDNPAIHVLSGDAYRKANDGSAAYLAYNKALEYNRSYAHALHQLGKIFLAQKSRDLYLDYFNQAITADASYAPSLYQLYAHYFYFDAAKAREYFNRYMAVSDATIERDYDLADILYLDKDYNKALEIARSIIEKEGAEAKPRIYKLSAYSFAGKGDSATAAAYMHRYFQIEEDSNLLAKDYELMSILTNEPDSVRYYLTKAVALEKDSSLVYGYYKKLADGAKQVKDYSSQASWLQKFYSGNEKATNVDLFNWGLAHYLAQEHQKADSVFGLYVTKYPEQSFGYYWRAKANASLDKEMKEGLAVPHYQKLVEVLSKDPSNSNYKKWLSEAYGYMAAYEANTEKDYKEAIVYFEKVLEVDPGNEDAKKYIDLLEKDSSPRENSN